LNWGTTENYTDNKDGYNNFKVNYLGSSSVSNDTIINDMQAALANGKAAEGNFVSILDHPDDLKGGDTSCAKAYVRLQPLNGLYTELQY
jgi:hypothetical protein